jgi:hypothetical protein
MAPDFPQQKLSDPQAVRRATDARIEVADEVLAAQNELILGETGDLRGESPQVGFDRGLVLIGRRYDSG